MFDNLVRRDPRDSGKTIIPDLAHSWQISKDGKTYTFFLRKDVQFHDGAEFTADDVKATYDRISKPPTGVSIPRSILFSSVSEINVRDKHTIEFKLAEPRPGQLHHVGLRQRLERHRPQEDAGGQSVQPAPRRRHSGHRPVQEQAPGRERSLGDGAQPELLEQGGCPISTASSSITACRSRPSSAPPFSPAARTMRASSIPSPSRKAQATPGMSSLNYYQSVIQGTWPNAKKKPFDDPRVRRAVHLVFERAVLVDVVKDVAPMLVGGFIYPFSEFATPLDQLVKRPGYQTDPTAAIKEAKALLAAAGYGNGAPPLDFLVRDVATFKLWAQAIQAMLQQSLSIECKLRTVVESVWFDDIKSGNFDMAVGAVVSTLLDPSDYFNAWYKKDGPQNYSGWDNAEFNALMPQIDSEVDPAKRLALIRKAEEILEKEVPVFPICWEKINDVWYNYVKGHNPKDYFGIYDVVRMDTMWLDKA